MDNKHGECRKASTNCLLASNKTLVAFDMLDDILFKGSGNSCKKQQISLFSYAHTYVFMDLNFDQIQSRFYGFKTYLSQQVITVWNILCCSQGCFKSLNGVRGMNTYCTCVRVCVCEGKRNEREHLFLTLNN